MKEDVFLLYDNKQRGTCLTKLHTSERVVGKRQNMTDLLFLCSELTDQRLPLAIGLGDLIPAAHLAVRHPTDNKYDDPWPRLHLCGAPVLVPVTIASTAVK